MGTVIPKKPSAKLVDTTPYTVGVERHVNADATAEDIDVVIPNHSCGSNRTVGKVDDSANVVKVYEDMDPDPNELLTTLTEQGQRAGFFCDGGVPYTVRGP
jgi:hypothetical protein